MATVYAGHVEGRFTIPAGITIAATTNAGGPTAVPITAGDYYLDEFITQFDADLESARTVTAGNWTVTRSSGAGASGLVTIAVTAGTYSITWTSTLLRDLLGFSGNITTQTTFTGTSMPRGLWLPDCPVTCDGRIAAAPLVTDLRQSETPTGRVYGHVGNSKYQHRNVMWSHCPTSRVWDADETYGESLETFLTNVQWGAGHSWFSPSSKVRITAHTGSLIGAAYVTGWYLKGATSMESVVSRVTDGWDGLFAARFESIVTDS